MDVLRPPPPPVQQQPPQPAAPPPFGYPPMGAAPPLAPGIPPQGPANVVPGLFPGWPPMGLPPMHVGQPQPPGAAAAAPTPVAPATAAPPSTPSAAGNVQQDANQAQVPAFGLPPPFMFPPPFMMPPFMLGGLSSPVNTNFSSMNIEQLVAAEAQERQNVEARINMLRTIHALLDAAIIQLNQYTQMVNEQSQATASAAESSNSAGVSASGAGPSQCDKGEAGPSGLGKENLLGAQSTAAMAGEASKPETLSSQPGPSLLSLPENTKLQASVTDNSQMDSSLNDENTEIRRRRLERFLSATNQNSDQDKND